MYLVALGHFRNLKNLTHRRSCCRDKGQKHSCTFKYTRYQTIQWLNFKTLILSFNKPKTVKKESDQQNIRKTRFKNNIVNHLWMILKIKLTQLARIKPTLPTERLRIQERNKNMQESITIKPLYLSNC